MKIPPSCKTLRRLPVSFFRPTIIEKYMETPLEAAWEGVRSELLFSSRRRYLPFPNVFTFVLRNEGKHLQHEVGNERPKQILVTPCIQEGHVQHPNVHLFLLREQLPLPLDFFIVAAQPVNAGDAEQITGL